VREADNLSPYCAVATKSGSLNFSEPSGPDQACYGTALTAEYFTAGREIKRESRVGTLANGIKRP